MSNTASTQGTTAKNSTAVDEKAEIARLAALSPLDYDRQREAVAQKLGFRRTTLDNLPRRGLSRLAAAIYIGVSPTKFDQLVDDGRMPGPRRIDGRKVWDVRELDLCFDDLPRADGPTLAGNSWDDR
jgi:hypothetical protein